MKRLQPASMTMTFPMRGSLPVHTSTQTGLSSQLTTRNLCSKTELRMGGYSFYFRMLPPILSLLGLVVEAGGWFSVLGFGFRGWD